MQRLGVIALWLGVLVTALGLVMGFAQLPSDDGAGAAPWLGAIPIGFALMVLGITLTQLTRK